MTITYWVLMLSRVGEAAGLPMAVYTDRAECEERIIAHKEPTETYWHCKGVIMGLFLPLPEDDQ